MAPNWNEKLDKVKERRESEVDDSDVAVAMLKEGMGQRNEKVV